MGRVAIATLAIIAATAGTGLAALPPGRPNVLTIKGETTVTFVPESGLPPLPIDYKARIEYLVHTRGLEPGPTQEGGARARKRAGRRTARGSGGEVEGADDAGPRPSGAVDLAVHSAEMTLRQNGQMVVQSRVNRSRFQGRLRPDAPALSVSYNQAPPALQELLKTFDTTAASILIDDRAQVVARRRRGAGPLHAIIETLLSIQTPMPRDVAAWEAPTQLAMGHGQTARGQLRFVKEGPGATGTGGPIRVKVAGVLEAEGVVVGNLIKDGRYTVTGEQSYAPQSREWTSARWSVEIQTELANQGTTIAHARGKMLVESRALDDPAAARIPKGEGR